MNLNLSRTENSTSIFLLRLLEILESEEIDIMEILSKANLPISFMQNKPERINRENLIKAEVLAGEKAYVNHIQGLGFQLAEKLLMADYGISSYAFLSCKTLRKALQHNIRFAELQEERHTKELIEDSNTAILRYHLTHPQYNNSNEPHVKYMLELVLYEITLWTRRALGKEFLFTEVHFTFDKPKNASIYTKYLGCPVMFNQEFNQGIFDKSTLGIKFETANEKIAKLCEQQCLTLLKTLRNKGGLSGEIQTILSRQPGYYPSMSKVAAELHMTSRTLRRKLKKENTNYRDLVLQLRLDLASEYLKNTNLSIKEIAYLLDYSSPTVFHRSFSKRFRISPNQYRNS